ncbi:MAG: hypothetical protein E7600_04735 [Ruminococcaceae bacterium]|nr:hypothetical protein [Oscillospiraceae bacterium]
MLEEMYSDIGLKVKGLAKAIFVIETILAIIVGLSLCFIDILIGLLVIICVSVFAWVSTWILYAFGELVHKTSENENNTRMIVKLMQPKTVQEGSGSIRRQEPDEKKEENRTYNADPPFWCGNCNYPGPYDGNCPSCGSSLKKYNVPKS